VNKNIAFIPKNADDVETRTSGNSGFKCGDVVVNLEFDKNAPDLQTMLKNFYIKKKNN
jgi:hypothetical protein